MARPETRGRSERLRRIAFGAVILQLVVQVAYVVLLLVGEDARLGFLALYAPRHPMALGAVLALGLALLARRRWLVIAQVAVTLFVVVFVMGLRVAGGGAPAKVPLTLATYNVYFGKLGRPELDEAIAALPADVIVLQAGFDSLQERLRARFPDRTVHQDYELVLVSKVPVREVEVPPMLPDELRPMFVTYVLETPGGPLVLVNMHPYSPRHALFGEADHETDVRRREAQVEAAVTSAKRRGLPFVLAGDTNLPAWSALARRHFAGMGDAFADAGRGFGYTFPAKRPWLRIDRVMLGPGVRAVEAHVVRGSGRPTSDHLPLVVGLDVAR